MFSFVHFMVNRAFKISIGTALKLRVNGRIAGGNIIWQHRRNALDPLPAACTGWPKNLFTAE